MLRTMDGEILGLSPAVFWSIIAAVVLVLVVLTTVLMICCCYCCCCKYTRKNKVSPHDDIESTTQLTPRRSDADLASYPDDVERGGSVVWPAYAAKVDSIRHEPPVVNCKYTRKNRVSPYDHFELTTQLTPHRWPGYGLFQFYTLPRTNHDLGAWWGLVLSLWSCSIYRGL